MQTGYAISGTAHAALIGWLLFGSVFRSEPPPMEVTTVSVISPAAFAALRDELATEAALPVAEPEPEPAPEPEPTPEPEPEPEPTPEPEPEAEPEALIIEDSPRPVVPVEPQAVPEPEISDRPVPRASERIAPEPVAPPDVDVRPDPVEQAAVQPEAEPAPETPPVEEQEETAPEEATTEITTEAEEPSSAPLASLRPPSRRPDPPQRQAEAEPEPEPAPDPEPAPEPEPEPEESPATDDAVAAALQEALGAPEPDAPQGPPLTSGEKDALRVAVSSCWNVGSLSTAALQTTVVVAVDMTEAGKPVTGSIRMVSYSGGAASAAEQAFQAARRAIIRCGARGYALPQAKFAQWKEIEMTFNPERMRIK